MNFEKIEIIYQMVLSKVFLNRHNFNLIRITDREIEELVNMNIIKPIDDELYEFIYIKGLYEYGVKLLQNKHGSYAHLCFLKAYELNPNDRDICIQYMIELVKRNDYGKALEVYNKMIINSSENNIKDDNLYLYLFSLLTKISVEDNDRVKYFSYNDVFVSNNRDNEIRKLIIQSKYSYACSLLNEKIRSIDKYVTSDMLIKALLVEVIEVERKYKKELLYNAKTENYDVIIDMLYERKQYKNLNRIENSILLLCETLKNGVKNNFIESCNFANIEGINNVYEAILIKDYRLAMELNTNFLEYNHEDKSKDVLHILLSKIESLMEEFENNKKEEETLENNNNDNLEDICVDSNDIDMSRVIKNAEEWAYYIKGLKIGIDRGIKKTALFIKYALLVKLVFARDFYLEDNYEMGDKYLFEVEDYHFTDVEVLYFLEEVKKLRDSKVYNKKLVK